MGIVNSEAVNQLAARQQPIPHLFKSGHTAAAGVVHRGVAVEHFEQPSALYLAQFLGGNRPAEVWVIDAWRASRGSNPVDHVLEHRHDARAPGRLDEAGRAETVDVDRLVAESSGDILALVT